MNAKISLSKNTAPKSEVPVMKQLKLFLFYLNHSAVREGSQLTQEIRRLCLRLRSGKTNAANKTDENNYSAFSSLPQVD